MSFSLSSFRSPSFSNPPSSRIVSTLCLAISVLLLIPLSPALAQTGSATAQASEEVSQDPSPGQQESSGASQEGTQDTVPEDTVPETDRDTFVDDIVVTARRRAENLQEIPVSVTAFDSDALEESSLRDLSDLSELTPNLDISLGPFAAGTSEAAVFIRGVGQGDTAVFSDPGVGIYVDGIYLARAQGAILDLLDLERVEVLRGPQGTLFGKNTTGGAISLVTRRPAERFGGQLTLTTGQYSRADVAASLDVPLSEKAHSKISVLSTNRDGWSRSLITGQEFYDDNRDAARLAFEFLPSERFNAYLTLEKTRERENGGNQILLDTSNPPLLDFYNRVLSENGFQPYTDTLWALDDYSTTFTKNPGFLDLDVEGAALHLSWTRTKTTLTSITGYRTTEAVNSSDGDGAPNIIAEADIDQEHDQFSQEIQLAGSQKGFEWIAGAIYLRERPRETSIQRVLGDLFPALQLAPGPIYAPPGFPDFLCAPGAPPTVPCFGGANNPMNFAFFVGPGLRQDVDLESESSAVFGEGTWAAGDRLSVTVGLRFTEDRKDFDYRAFDGLGQVTSDLTASDSWSDWSGRVSLAYQATPSTLYYSSLSRGFKSGGFNGRPQQRQVLDPFDPETLLSLEIGAKSDLLDRRVRLNGSAFWSDYEDVHFAASLDVGGVPVFVTQNAGDAEIWGLEGELQAYLAPTFLLTASLGTVDNKLTRIDPRVPPETVDLDDKLPRTPRWTGSLSLQKTWIVADSHALIGRVGYSWRSRTFQDFANNPTVAQDAYGLLNARLLYAPPSGRWDIALFGTNLTDEQYLESGFVAGAFGASIGLSGRPREWGLSASLRY